jgi:hypothetical protein
MIGPDVRLMGLQLAMSLAVETNTGQLRRCAFEVAELSAELADVSNQLSRQSRQPVAQIAARLAAVAEQLAVGATSGSSSEHESRASAGDHHR